MIVRVFVVYVCTVRHDSQSYPCVAVCCSVLQCVAVCCSVLQCVAVCCSVLQCVALSRKCAARLIVSTLVICVLYFKERSGM